MSGIGLSRTAGSTSPGQLPFHAPFVDECRVVQEPLVVGGAQIDAVEVQSVDDIDDVAAADQGLPDGGIDEPFEDRHDVGHVASQGTGNSLSSVHVVNSLNKRWFSAAVAG